MDLSVYISELLIEHGEVSIPQIGVFKQVRMRGYFNADEGKLYPPYYQTEFEFAQVEDDSLLRYIIAKSKISPTSAKYFMDKYLFNILQQAEIGEVMIGRLGWISREGDALRFRPVADAKANPSVFGFAPVSINEQPVVQDKVTIEESPVVEEQTQPEEPKVYSVEKPVTEPVAEELPKPAISPLLRKPENKATEPVSANVVTPAVEQTPAAVTPSADAHAEAPLAKAPFYAKPWFFALAAAVIVLVVIAVLYPKTEGKSTDTLPAENAPTPSMDSVKVTRPAVAAGQDSTVKYQPVLPKDTAPRKPLPESTEFAPEVETPPAPVVPTLVNTKNYKFVLMSGAFSNAIEAEKVVNRYKAIGVDAAILKNVSPSKYVKVTLGFFKTYAEGQAAKIRLVKLKHLRSSDLYVETLRTKRK